MCSRANRGNLAGDIFDYLESYSLDIVIMEVELTELNQSRNVFFKSSKQRQLIERIGCWTLMMNFGIIGKTMPSNEKTVSGNILFCFVSMWKTALLSAN